MLVAVVLLVTSWFLSAVPISASTLPWSAETIPSTTGGMVVPGTDISDLAVAGNYSTIYATDRESDKIYRSTDGGLTWSSVTVSGATEPQLVAVAPDDANIAAIVADGTEVYVTTNGGGSWIGLGTVQESGGAAASTLYDITISAKSAGVHYVAVVGTEAGPRANVWYYDFGAASPSWRETNSKAGFGVTSVNSRAAAVAFSPNFASDRVMVAITEGDDGGKIPDYVGFEIFSFNQKEWNGAAGFSGYPVTIATGTGITGLDSASISLAPDYLGSDDALRMAFVGLTVAGDTYAVATSGIYRLTDNRVKALKTNAKIHSVAFDGTNLVAGAYDTTIVYRSADPLASSPTVSSASSLKRPGGEKKVVVAWAVSSVVAGTTGNESAFAVSRDNGKTFNDVSLIDTTIATMSDVAVSPDGSKVYLATDDGTDLSLWRYTLSWERVLSRAGETGYIVRLAPEDPDVVYVAKRNSATLYYTQEGGDTRWSTRASKYAIQDLAVESAEVAYIAVSSSKTVSKTTNRGFTWGSAKDTGLGSGNIHTITSLGEDELIVGSTTGYVSYSTDGNSSWTNMSQQIESDALKVQVTASGLDNGDYIYAASSKADTKVLRWQIGTSTAWEDMTAPTTATYGAYGMALHDGVLYVVNSDATANSEFLRTPNPTASVVFWSKFAIPGKTFTTEPSALRVSTGSTKLWAIDTIQPALFGFGDTVETVAPTLTGPTDGMEVKINPITGKAFDITFTWLSPSDKVEEYDLQVALDSAFDQTVLDAAVADDADEGETVSQVVGPGVGDTDFQLQFMQGATYYWRVRVDIDSPFRSPWSEVRTFAIAEAEVMPPVIVEPAPPAPIPAPTLVPPPPPPPPPPIPLVLVVIIVVAGGAAVAGSVITVRHSVKVRRHKEWREKAKEEEPTKEEEPKEPCQPCTHDCRWKELELEPALRKIACLSLSAKDPVSSEQSKERQAKGKIVDKLNELVTAHRQGEKSEKLQEQAARLAHQLLQQIIEWLHGEPIPRDISIVGHLAGGKVTYQYILYHCKRRGNVNMWEEEEKWKETLEEKRDERVGTLRNLDPTERKVPEDKASELTRLLMQFVEKV